MFIIIQLLHFFASVSFVGTITWGLLRAGLCIALGRVLRERSPVVYHSGGDSPGGFLRIFNIAPFFLQLETVITINLQQYVNFN